MRAGAAYVPLDPAAPPARLAGIAADADLRVLITGREKSELWPDLLEGGAPVETLVALNAADHDVSDPGVTLLTRDGARRAHG